MAENIRHFFKNIRRIFQKHRVFAQFVRCFSRLGIGGTPQAFVRTVIVGSCPAMTVRRGSPQIKNLLFNFFIYTAGKIQRHVNHVFLFFVLQGGKSYCEFRFFFPSVALKTGRCYISACFTFNWNYLHFIL